MKGELKGDTEHQVLQGIINHGLQRIDLRDEIFCQLMRQTSDNPHEDLCLRVWQIMCLCVVSFHPSRTLKKVITHRTVASDSCVVFCIVLDQLTSSILPQLIFCF